MYYIIYDNKGEIKKVISTILENYTPPLDAGESYITNQTFVDDTLYYMENNALVAFPTSPSKYHEWDWVTKTWVPIQYAKQAAFEDKLREMQDIIRSMQRDNPIQSEDATLSIANFYATDNFRYKLEHPESFGVNGEGGVRFWDADGGEQLVGIGWFDFYNPLVNILKRDKLLDTQLYEARLDILAMVSDPTKTPVDIINYDPGFTLPSYPYN